jgi:hypothetical protein
VCTVASKYLPFVRGLPLVAAVFTTTRRHANHSLHGPSKSAWRELKRLVPCRLNFGDQKSHLNAVVFFTPFSAAFTLKHRECKQASAHRRGGLLLRGSAPMRSWFLPLRGHPPRKQTLALGSCLTLAPSGWCALRDSGHQRRFCDVCIC